MISVTSFGQSANAWRDELIQKTKKIIPFQWQDWPIKKMPSERPPQLLSEEKKFLSKYNQFTLCDVKGKNLSDLELYKFCLGSESRHFVIGPAIGFHPEFYDKANGKISLSSLTFTHELAQVILAESLYRVAAKSINHPFVK